MSHLPVRLRLTVAFAAVMALVLTAVGALLYVRLGSSLAEQLDESLVLRAETLAGAGASDASLASGDDDGFAQLLAEDGSIVASSPAVAGRALVTRAEIERARSESYFVRRDRHRLYVTPVDQGVLVVGASLEDRDEALDGLVAELLVVGPLALVLSSLAGYLLAAAALRPVEAMRRQAAEVTSEESSRRLPLSPARDELRRLGETLNAMLGRLESALARERRFAADASHELRTPLALLQSELELALRRTRSRGELEAAVRSAAEEVDRLVRLAEDLLVLTQADEGGLPLRRSDILPRELLEAVARRFSSRAEVDGRAIEVAADGEGPFSGDRMRLEQALSNLVDNALRHGEGTVRLAAVRRNGTVELSVADRGSGFPPDFAPHAFERFTRADAARGRGGAGLGLALVGAVARAHGGTVSLRNGERAGAVVSLTLPAER
jgi:two-component system OmpR family sensor kinase